MNVEASDFFKAYYYKSSSLKPDSQNLNSKVDEKAKFILQDYKPVVLKPELSKWKIALSIAIPLIPLTYAITSIAKMLTYRKREHHLLELINELSVDKNNHDQKFKNTHRAIAINYLVDKQVELLKETPLSFRLDYKSLKELTHNSK